MWSIYRDTRFTQYNLTLFGLFAVYSIFCLRFENALRDSMFELIKIKYYYY